MSYRRLALKTVLLSVFSLTLYAADIPQDDVETQDLNTDQCVDDNTQTCINDQCLTSEDTDCQDQCADMATAKCRDQADE